MYEKEKKKVRKFQFGNAFVAFYFRERHVYTLIYVQDLVAGTSAIDYSRVLGLWGNTYMHKYLKQVTEKNN